jgi:hypothetical protein
MSFTYGNARIVVELLRTWFSLLSPSRTALSPKSRTFCCIALHYIQTSTVPREASFVGMYGKNQQSFPLTRSFVQKLVIANFWGRKFLPFAFDVMPAILNALFCVEYPILTHTKFDTLNVKVWFHAYRVVKIESRSFSSAEIQHFRTENTRSD